MTFYSNDGQYISDFVSQVCWGLSGLKKVHANFWGSVAKLLKGVYPLKQNTLFSHLNYVFLSFLTIALISIKRGTTCKTDLYIWFYNSLNKMTKQHISTLQLTTRVDPANVQRKPCNYNLLLSSIPPNNPRWLVITLFTTEYQYRHVWIHIRGEQWLLKESWPHWSLPNSYYKRMWHISVPERFVFLTLQ